MKISSAGYKTLPYKGNLVQCRARFYTAPKKLSAGYKTLPYKGKLAQCRARFYTAPKKFVGRV